MKTSRKKIKIHSLIGLLLVSFYALFSPFSVLQAQELKYTSANGDWNADSLGNHRVLVHFEGTSKVAKVVVEWRRRDFEPEKKNLIIEDAQTHKRILNVKRGLINREFGEMYFEPTSGSGDYFIYYLPYKSSGRSNYPKNTYPEFVETADANWLSLLSDPSSITEAKVVEIQSIDEFNSFYPMEVIATAAEVQSINEKYFDKPFVVFPEDRLHPIKMVKDLPQRWIMAGPKNSFSDEARKGENFAFQLGIYANQDIRNVQVAFSDLKSSKGESISSNSIYCINTNGINWDGKPLIKRVDVTKGHVQALWCGIDIPKDIKAGSYSGIATVKVDNSYSKDINLTINVNDQVLTDGGVNEPWKQTRLKWLNSTLAQENTVIPPYTPLVVKGKTISLLGRKVELNNDGFPKSIQAFLPLK